MNKGNMILKLMCLVISFALCLSVVPAVAEEALEGEQLVTESIENVTEAESEVTEEETFVEEESEAATDADEEETEVWEEEEEILDLFAATMRDGGVYVTPTADNAAVFNYDGVRYKVAAGTVNSIRLDGFETNVEIEKEEMAPGVKNKMQANGEITPDAAHSGYFGLAIKAGDVVYRAAVTGDENYVFSAWVRMNGGSVNDDGRAFRVVSEGGDEYIVGYNEIGRDVDATGMWQQILFTFKAPETGLFQMDFNYKGSKVMAMDDLELYEVTVFDNPLNIEETVCIDAEGNEYNNSTGFTTSGLLTHKTVLYNSDEDDVNYVAVMALYKNDILIDFDFINDCALVLDTTEVTFEIEIPEDEDLSQYKYMVYFISDTTPTQFYGAVPSRTNPYVVMGK